MFINKKARHLYRKFYTPKKNVNNIQNSSVIYSKIKVDDEVLVEPNTVKDNVEQPKVRKRNNVKASEPEINNEL